MSDSSGTESLPSATGRRKRVAFDVLSSDDDAGVQRSSDRKVDRKVEHFSSKYKFLKIHPSWIRRTGRDDKVQFLSTDNLQNLCITWARRAELRTTFVDLHSRGDSPYASNLIVNEARVLQECRHPNVLFMLGFVFMAVYSTQGGR